MTTSWPASYGGRRCAAFNSRPSIWPIPNACTQLTRRPIGFVFLTNSELAEEAAYALFSRSTALPTHVVEWLQMAEYYGCYALVMALARTTAVRADHLEAAFAALYRFATPLLAKGVVTLAAAAAMQGEELRQSVERLMAAADLPHGDYIRDELAWRIQ